MLINKSKVASAIAGGALLFYSFATPVLASTSLEISGNGASSKNEAEVEVKQTTTVVQSNDADIKNYIDAKADTGDNNASYNTNGNVSVETGNATTTVDVSNQANLNVADVQNCGGCSGDANVLISGNGADSKNEAEVENKNETSVYQNNDAYIENDIDAEAETGDNDANYNTGGEVSINTGNAATTVGVINTANANIAQVGRSSGTDSGGVSIQITGNGAGSENEAELELERSIVIVQDNNAHIKNKVNADAETGDNDANYNTGGEVSINTGNANTTVNVDNRANFNTASADCCIFDLTAKISGNGADSENEIEAEFENNLLVFQGGESKQTENTQYENGAGNDAYLCNYLDVESETGDNDTKFNTGSVSSDDIAISTGNAVTDTTVANNANVNLFGNLSGLDLPEFGFHFDLSGLLGQLHLG